MRQWDSPDYSGTRIAWDKADFVKRSAHPLSTHREVVACWEQQHRLQCTGIALADGLRTVHVPIVAAVM